ncbi:MAG: chemotaxis protein CheW [Gammaproteobacteria bacterium]|nr:chemotaxis protein CheW [Gammaproteobacteria bacterium]
MINTENNCLDPESALSRFKKPENLLINDHAEGKKTAINRYGFVVENMGLLISENTLSEVVRNKNICPLPNTRKWMKGLINIRGNLVPVYDLSLLLGLTSVSSNYNNVLVLGKGVRSVAVVIEGLPRQCNVSDWHKMVDFPCDIPGLKDHIIEVYMSDKIVWMDFNQHSFFESVKRNVVM